MKLVMLGSGTSTGVPRVGHDWGLCDPAEPRNRRSRVSIAVENDAGQRILVDTSPDLRSQLLARRIERVDAVFWTHDHADHCHGIDDLRVMRFDRSNPIPGYGVAETCRRLKLRFDYVFDGQHGYPTIVDLHELETAPRLCSGFAIGWSKMPHGPAKSTGLRFDADGASVGYATDYSEITSDMIDLFKGVDVLVTDCLRRKPHPTHANLDMALELASQCKARRTVLTHLDKSMDYATLVAELPDRVQPGYDGLEIVL